jgi:DNA-binding CsgD family transcriptional regulator
VFDVLGLSSSEQAVYESLLTQASATEPQAVLDRLVELGLAALEDGRYVPTPPDLALETLLLAREEQLVAEHRRLVEQGGRYRRDSPDSADSADAVEVVHGANAIIQRFFDVQNHAPHEVRGVEGPPYIAPDYDDGDTVYTLLERGTTYRILYDRRALDVPGRPYGAVLDVSDGRQVRIGDAPVKLVLTDEPIGFLPLHVDPDRRPAAMVVREPALLAALSALFELYWERAVPISVGSGFSETDRELLPLLVAGLTDPEIAGKTGWSPRTVRRRVRDLMDRLDARTRFQAGHNAVLRGWPDGNPETTPDDDR